jgi:hypothetical protein
MRSCTQLLQPLVSQIHLCLPRGARTTRYPFPLAAFAVSLRRPGGKRISRLRKNKREGEAILRQRGGRGSSGRHSHPIKNRNRPAEQGREAEEVSRIRIALCFPKGAAHSQSNFNARRASSSACFTIYSNSGPTRLIASCIETRGALGQRKQLPHLTSFSKRQDHFATQLLNRSPRRLSLSSSKCTIVAHSPVDCKRVNNLGFLEVCRQ